MVAEKDVRQALAFLDIETTGLDPDMYDVFEVALIEANPVGDEDEWWFDEHVWHIEPRLAVADPEAIRMNRYYQRRAAGELHFRAAVNVAEQLARGLAGRTVIGANPDFDGRHLTRFLKKHGQCPAWHYHLVDIENVALGWCRARIHAIGIAMDENLPVGGGWNAAGNIEESDVAVLRRAVAAPYKSALLSRAIGVDPGDFERHTALGDARWVKAMWEAMHGLFKIAEPEPLLEDTPAPSVDASL